jgi:serine/threonine protein kinase
MRESAGPYRLLERTGEDRLGEIWRARDTARGRTASVRLVRSDVSGNPSRRAALAADATRAAAISHPSVAALFDVIDEPGDLALAHEHVEGKSLAATLGGTPLNPRLAVAIAIQIADGVAEIHANDLAHGAVDADHIVINPRGQAKLVDTGLLHWLSDRHEADADMDAARAADISALGTLLSTMAGTSLPKAQWAADLRAVIDRARSDHPRRFESAPTLAAELRSVAAMLEARADAAPPPSAGSGMSAVLWLLLGVLLLALGAWFLFG